LVDPIVLAAAVGLVASPIGGRAIVVGLDRVDPSRRRLVEWALVGGVSALALVNECLPASAARTGIYILLLGALPGIVIYIVSGTALASAVVSLVPLYFGIGAFTANRPLHTPYIALDRLMPLQPAWMLVYASMYVFVLLPLLIVREPRLFRRAMACYITVLTLAYVGFILYPTMAPRPDTVPGSGFAAWALRQQYSMDWRYNCFPSLHVAHSFVSALTVYRVRKDVGTIATAWAALIGVSTVFTKQHYVVDVIGGVLIAFAAYAIFLHGFARASVPAIDYERAPRRALYVVAVFGAVVVAMWMVRSLTCVGNC